MSLRQNILRLEDEEVNFVEDKSMHSRLSLNLVTAGTQRQGNLLDRLGEHAADTG